MTTVALGELEVKVVADVLSWLCGQRVFGSITLRNALLALRRYPADVNAGPAAVEEGA